MKIGTDMLSIIKEEGIDYVKNNLETWLKETTASGSGDDITLGLLYNTVSEKVDNNLNIPETQVSLDGEAENDNKDDKEKTGPISAQNRKKAQQAQRRLMIKRMKQLGPLELSKRKDDIEE